MALGEGQELWGLWEMCGEGEDMGPQALSPVLTALLWGWSAALPWLCVLPGHLCCACDVHQ